MKELGCSDGGCWFRHNTGQVTTGGCHCVRAQATNTGGAWTIPVQRVRIMIARAARIAVEKERTGGIMNTKHDEHEILNCTICNQVKHLNDMWTVDVCNDCQKYTKALDIVRRLAKLPTDDELLIDNEDPHEAGDMVDKLIREARKLEE